MQQLDVSVCASYLQQRDVSACECYLQQRGMCLRVSAISVISYLPRHLFIGLLCHCEYVWVQVAQILARVCVDHSVSVDWQPLVGVNGHQNDPCRMDNRNS